MYKLIAIIRLIFVAFRHHRDEAQRRMVVTNRLMMVYPYFGLSHTFSPDTVFRINGETKPTINGMNIAERISAKFNTVVLFSAI